MAHNASNQIRDYYRLDFNPFTPRPHYEEIISYSNLYICGWNSMIFICHLNETFLTGPHIFFLGFFKMNIKFYLFGDFFLGATKNYKKWKR